MLGDTQLEGKSRVEDDHSSLYIYMKFSRIKTSIKLKKQNTINIATHQTTIIEMYFFP